MFVTLVSKSVLGRILIIYRWLEYGPLVDTRERTLRSMRRALLVALVALAEVGPAGRGANEAPMFVVRGKFNVDATGGDVLLELGVNVLLERGLLLKAENILLLVWLVVDLLF